MGNRKGIHLTYLAHLKKQAKNAVKNSLCFALIMRLFLLIKLSWQIGALHKVVATIGIVRDVVKCVRRRNTDAS